MMLFKYIRKFDFFLSDILSRIFSLFLIIFFSPIYLIIYLLILWIDGKPIFYNSNRLGYLEKPFILYKFRTMSNCDKEENLRITKLGKFLRRSSLDELPQLLNILKGEMVFVGPRPLPVSILYEINNKRYTKKRSSVKPGLTGLSQAFSKGVPRKYLQKLVYDFIYIKKKSIFFDLIIIYLTFRALRKRFVFNKTGNTL